MTTYLVWETEYPEEGSFEVEADSIEAAKAKYREETGEPEVEVEADVLTPELALIREASCDGQSAGRIVSNLLKALKVAREKGEHYPVCNMPPKEVRAAGWEEQRAWREANRGKCDCWKAQMEAAARGDA